MSEPYRPIACADHERLEFAVLRRLPLTLRLLDGRSLSGKALDVFTREGAEWLRLREANGSEHVLRLDEIATIHDS
ncbi:Rho-binding antiterminator [Thiobacter aerophilum]|uniref:Rho-binding antiterminator n=1 Tax=Thiobacter aerophilum TaxID=3121275 RepID=A0ABV0EAD7_9BURK